MTITTNPFSIMLASLPPDLFFGRRSLIAAILESLSAPTPASFSIYGPRTLGKTSLLRYLCHTERHHLEMATTRFIYTDFRNVSSSQIVPALADAIFVSMRESSAPPTFRREDIRADNTEQLRADLTRYLNAIAPQNRLVFCIDHFDRAFSNISAADDSFLRQLTDIHSYVIASEEQLSELLAKGARVESFFVQVLLPRQIELLSLDECKELADKPSAKAGQKFATAEIDYIAQFMGGNPLLLTLGCEYLFNLARLNEGYANLRDSLHKNQTLQEQVSVALESSSTIEQVLRLIDETAGPAAIAALNKVLSGQQLDHQDARLAVQKSLMVSDFETGSYRPFSEVYRRHALSLGAPAQGLNRVVGILDLTRIDRVVLEYLLAHSGQVCSFAELLSLWGDNNATKRGLEAVVHRLRGEFKRKEIQHLSIENVRGEGFKLLVS